jgi:hypothetical protein
MSSSRHRPDYDLTFLLDDRAEIAATRWIVYQDDLTFLPRRFRNTFKGECCETVDYSHVDFVATSDFFRLLQSSRYESLSCRDATAGDLSDHLA